jgi:hypothetical protein
MMFFSDRRDRGGTRHCLIFPSSPAQSIVTDIASEFALKISNLSFVKSLPKIIG